MNESSFPTAHASGLASVVHELCWRMCWSMCSSLFMWHPPTERMKELPSYSLRVWEWGLGRYWVVGGAVWSGVEGQPVIHPEERKGECVLDSIPKKKKRGKGEKRKTRIPSAGRAVLRDSRFINTHTRTHTCTKHRHRPAMNSALMYFLSLVTLVWMI